MGIVYTTIKVKNPLKDLEPVQLEAKVDTGATLLVIPEDVAPVDFSPIILGGCVIPPTPEGCGSQRRKDL